MKVLICGECPDSLTTVAQNLNRLLSQQMRPDFAIPTQPTAATAVPSEVPEINKPAALFIKTHL